MALCSSLTTRVLLNIREVARSGRGLESGATTHDYTFPLAFHSCSIRELRILLKRKQNNGLYMGYLLRVILAGL